MEARDGSMEAPVDQQSVVLRMVSRIERKVLISEE